MLQTRASHPHTRHYVLKLHRDARPQHGPLFGRLENLRTGRCFVFANADELLQCLARDLASAGEAPADLSPDGE